MNATKYLLLAIILLCSSGDAAAEESLLVKALRVIYGRDSHSGYGSSGTYSWNESVSMVTRPCSGVLHAKDRQRLGCCRPKGLLHLHNVRFDGRSVVAFTGSPASSSRAGKQSMENLQALPAIASVAERVQKVFKANLIHRPEDFDPQRQCSSYFKGTLHVQGLFTVDNVFHSLNDNVLPLLSQTVQDVYLYPEFAFAPRARLVGFAVMKGKVVPHLGILTKAVPTSFHVDQLHGACFQRVIWGSGLRLIYNHVLGRLRRETMDLLRTVVMLGYSPPNPYSSAATNSLLSVDLRAKQLARNSEFLTRKRPDRPQRREVSKLQPHSHLKSVDTSAIEIDRASMEEVVQFTKKALSSILRGVDDPTLAAAVRTALQEIDRERRNSTQETNSTHTVNDTDEIFTLLRRQLRHHTPKQIPIKHSNRGEGVIPLTPGAKQSQLVGSRGNLPRVDELESIVQSHTESVGTHSNGAATSTLVSADSHFFAPHLKTVPLCASCAFYPPSACISPLTSISVPNRYNHSDFNCFVTDPEIVRGVKNVSYPSRIANNYQSEQHMRPLNVVVFSRGSTGKGRTIAHETLLIDHLVNEMGANALICCDFRRVSFAEQLGYSIHADVVIGLHGAGLANLMFAPHGVIVIELKMRYGFGLDLFAVSAEGRLGTLVHLDVRQYERSGVNKPMDSDLINRIANGLSLALQQRKNIIAKRYIPYSQQKLAAPYEQNSSLSLSTSRDRFYVNEISPVQHIPEGQPGDLLVFPTPLALAIAIDEPRTEHSSTRRFKIDESLDTDYLTNILGPGGSKEHVSVACSALSLKKFWSTVKSDTKQFCLPCDVRPAAD